MLRNRHITMLLIAAAFLVFVSACGTPTPTNTPRPQPTNTVAAPTTQPTTEPPVAPTSAATEAAATTPEATAAATEMTMATPEATAAATEMTMATPEATAAATEMTMATPEATAAATEMTMATPEATAAATEMTMATPEATAEATLPVTDPTPLVTPEATAAATEMTMTTPEATAEATVITIDPVVTVEPTIDIVTPEATVEATAVPPTATPVPPTEVPTEVPPTATPVPPTEVPTEVPPTATPVPPTEVPTEVPPTATPVPPTEVPTEVAMTTPEATTEATAEATEAATLVPTVAVTAVPTIGACRATGDLIVGTDAAFPPFENVNTTTGQIEGFDIDLLNAIGAKVGFTPQYQNAAFDPIFTNLAAGQFDIVISASTITEARQQTVSFSNPYFAASQLIIVRQEDAATVKGPADLAGKTVGVQLGTTGAEAAKGINGVTVREYQTAPEAFQALANRDVDAVVNDNVVSLTILLNQPDLNLVVVGEPFTVEYYGIAVRKECSDLLDQINKGLEEVIMDGTYAEIYRKYLGSDPGAEFMPGAMGIKPGEATATPEATPEATAEPTAAPTQGS